MSSQQTIQEECRNVARPSISRVRIVGGRPLWLVACSANMRPAHRARTHQFKCSSASQMERSGGCCVPLCAFLCFCLVCVVLRLRPTTARRSRCDILADALPSLHSRSCGLWHTGGYSSGDEGQQCPFADVAVFSLVADGPVRLHTRLCKAVSGAGASGSRPEIACQTLGARFH